MTTVEQYSSSVEPPNNEIPEGFSFYQNGDPEHEVYKRLLIYWKEHPEIFRISDTAYGDDGILQDYISVYIRNGFKKNIDKKGELTPEGLKLEKELLEKE